MKTHCWVIWLDNCLYKLCIILMPCNLCCVYVQGIIHIPQDYFTGICDNHITDPTTLMGISQTNPLKNINKQSNCKQNHKHFLVPLACNFTNCQSTSLQLSIFPQYLVYPSYSLCLFKFVKKYKSISSIVSEIRGYTWKVHMAMFTRQDGKL